MTEDLLERPRPGQYELSHLRVLRPRPSTSSARSPPSSNARCCFSGARTRSSCCTWRSRRSPRTAAVPGDARRHRPQLRRGDRHPATSWSPATAYAWWSSASVQDDIDAGRVVDDHTGRRATPADRHPAARAIRENVRRRVRRRPATRRRPAPRSACSASATSSASGTRRTSARAVEPLYNGRHRKGEHIRCSRCRTGPSSTSGPARRRGGHPDARDLLRPHQARCSSATACRWRSQPAAVATARWSRRTVRFRTVGDAPAPAASSPRRHRRAGHRRAITRGTRRHPRRRPDLRGRRWKTASGGVLLMSPWTCSAATAGSVDDGKSTLIGRLLLRLEGGLRGPARSRRAHQPSNGRHDYTDLALVTDGLRAEARAGHHHRRGLPLLRHGQAEIHHRRHPGHIQYTRQHGHRRLDRRPGDRARRRRRAC